MFRSWLRFSIRDVLWLTLVVALALSWWAYHWRSDAERATQRRQSLLWKFRAEQLQHSLSERGVIAEWGPDEGKSAFNVYYKHKTVLPPGDQ